MFASPAAGQVYRVAKAANAGGGVLLSYGNYAGDVLHFGQAQLRLNAEASKPEPSPLPMTLPARQSNNWRSAAESPAT